MPTYLESFMEKKEFTPPYKEVKKSVENFRAPNPYDYLKLSFVFDKAELPSKFETHIPAINPEQQINKAIEMMKEAYGERFIWLGVSGSLAQGTANNFSDIDAVAVIEGKHVPQQLEFAGDFKIINQNDLREFLLRGHTLLSNQFKKALTRFNKSPKTEELITKLKELKPNPELALPFLEARAHFSMQSADIYHLLNEKHKAIYLFEQGYPQEAFELLEGKDSDALFNFEQTRQVENDQDKMLNVKLAHFYSVHSVNRLHHALSDIGQTLHVKITGETADLAPLRAFIRQTDTEAGNIFETIYEKKKACFKHGEFLPDAQYHQLRNLATKALQTIESSIKLKEVSDQNIYG